MLAINENNIPLIQINEDFLDEKNVKLFILREDLNHPEISGNKWRKLKYNLQKAKDENIDTLLTFGGSYSNHIAATAAAGRDFNLKTIGIIRGDEILPLNPTLQLAEDNGMIFKYISRADYRENNKYDPTFLAKLKEEFGNFHLVPEGGSNAFAVKGCTEIVNNINIDYDIICSACGTGGTLTGVIASLNNTKKILGFPALKGGDFLKKDISELLSLYEKQFNVKVENNNWDLITTYHFGGFAKVKPELINFIRDFKEKHNVLLDFIYTGKMMYGLFDMIKASDQWNNKTIIAIHTGGIQGNKGFEDRLKIKL